MRFSGPSAAAQVLARGWLLAAAGSLLLPAQHRLGWWLPLHLALAGAAGTAISGALPLFAKALAGAHDLPQRWDPVLLVTLGTGGIAAGRPLGLTWLVAAGGAAYGLGALRLTWLVLRARLAGANRRHTMTLLAYGAASLSLTLGAILGALLGGGSVAAPAYLDVRSAHVTLNAEGFLALTVAGSLLVLVPIVLRIRAPDATGRIAVIGIALGVAVQAGGHLAASAGVVIGGASLALVGAVDLVRISILAVARRPRMPEPAAGWHLLAVPLWLAGILASVLLQAVRGNPAWPLPLTAALAIGVLVQALVGAWSYLLPVSDPGGGPARRARLERTRPWAITRAIAFNLGAALTVGAAAGLLPVAVAPSALGLTAISAAASILLASRSPRPGG